MRQHTAFITSWRRGLLICSLLLTFPFSLRAQETAQPPAPSAQGAEQAEPPDTAPPHHEKGHMRERHEQMEAMHKEMDAELEQKMTTLRAHAQTMASITDTQLLVSALQKHQQLSDEVLNTLIEQRQRMRAKMHEHRQHGRHHTGHRQRGHHHKEHQDKPGCCSMMEHQDKPGCCSMTGHQDPPVSSQ
ncbi:MAG: hypothetical protein HOP18_12565 [Deltaproteobacteria bacterium]|nr:hypothetical protein [Deltaproteobacteria bacterium]